MATFNSNLIAKRNRHRGIYSGRPYNVEGRIVFSEGAELAEGDILLIAPIGENQRVNKVRSYVIGDVGEAEVTIGYAQILDADGQPAVVERLGPLSDDESRFESPESDLDAFAPAAALQDAREYVIVGNPNKLPGPVYLAAEVTAAGTVGGDGAEVHIGAEFDGETSLRETGGETWWEKQSYLLG